MIIIGYIVPFPYNMPCLILYVTSFIMSLLAGYSIDSDYLRHELKHVYLLCILEKLKQQGLLNLSIDRIDALLPFDHGLSSPFVSNRVNIGTLKEIEYTIIETLFPIPNLDSYRYDLPKSDIPVDAESSRRVLEIRALHEQL